MSRIRSIHPALWTDEHFVMLSPLARLFFLGILTECDDQGVFQWSPVQLKIRLLPMEGMDPSKLLLELVDGGFLLSYAFENRRYGAVKNFMVFQRPKAPNHVFPITSEIAEFVGLGPDGKGRRTTRKGDSDRKGDAEDLFGSGGEEKANDFGSGGEKPAHRRGGERRGEEGRGVSRATALPADFQPVLTEKAQENWDWLKSPERELERFRDHAAQNGRKAVDWQAAFRTWLSKAVEYEENGNERSGGKPSGWLPIIRGE